MVVNALVVPDEQTWTVWGVDPASLGAEPVFEPAAVRRLLLPERVPEVLVGPLANWLVSVPHDAVPDERRLPFPGSFDIDAMRPGDALERTREHADHHEHEGHHGHEGHDEHRHHDDHERHDEHADHHEHAGHGEHAGHESGSDDEHAGHGEHGGHDHGDMMAIVGEPSADGLVMEPIELRFGSLGTPLPAGLAADVKLDGDVVAECRITALLADASAPGPPDRLAPEAWQLALTVARERDEGVSAPPRERWTRVAVVELERAVSHTAWLRAFARLLGWPELIERCGRVLAALDDARALDLPRLDDAQRRLSGLSAFVHESRRLRWRTTGRGRVPQHHARHLGLRGPAARASGIPDDARSDDPLYRRLGFKPIVRAEGDVLARTLVRAAEAAVAADLAARAVRAAADADLAEALPPGTGPVEGPRGPLEVALDGSAEAPGETSARAAAANTAIGAEWGAALVILASFDLSPWRVGV